MKRIRVQINGVWDTPPPPEVLSSVPEPATMTLLALGGLTLLRRRKQAA